MDKIVFAHGQTRVAASKLDAVGTAFDAKLIVQGHGLNDGFQLVKVILTFAQNIEQQVDLAVRLENEAHRRGLVFVVKGGFFAGLFAAHEPRDDGAQFVEQLHRHGHERERHGIAGGGDDGGKDDVGHHGIHP